MDIDYTAELLGDTLIEIKVQPGFKIRISNTVNILTATQEMNVFAMQRTNDRFTSASNGRSLPEEGTVSRYSGDDASFFEQQLTLKPLAHAILYCYILWALYTTSDIGDSTNQRLPENCLDIKVIPVCRIYLERKISSSPFNAYDYNLLQLKLAYLSIFAYKFGRKVG